MCTFSIILPASKWLYSSSTTGFKAYGTGRALQNLCAPVLTSSLAFTPFIVPNIQIDLSATLRSKIRDCYLNMVAECGVRPIN